MTRLAALALLALAGCNQPAETTATDANAINALNAANSNSAEIEELRARLDELEAEEEATSNAIGRLDRYVAADFEDTKSNIEIYNHFKDTTNDRLDRLEARLGM